MLARQLQLMRRRVGGTVTCAVLCGLLAPPDLAAAPSPLYLRQDLTLSIAAPSSTTPADINVNVGSGQRAVLAEFLSAPVEEETLQAATATASLFLFSGRIGMEDCAVVSVEVARRTPPSERTVVGQGELLTSILQRRSTVDPIEISFALSGVIAGPGERVAVSIAVENRCNDLRQPGLLYDALGLDSVVRFSDEPPPTTTSTTTTTTTTTTTLPPPTTTTTLPWPDGCLFQPLAGYDQIWCHLDTIAETLVDETADAFGGEVTLQRLQRRLARARDLVTAAQAGTRVRRHLRLARQQLVAFNRIVQRKQRKGRIEPDVGDDLVDLGGSAARAIDGLR